jgi:hypothetical protein
MSSTALIATNSTGDTDQAATLATPEAEAPRPITPSPALVVCQGWDNFQSFKALLSSPIEALVEKNSDVLCALELFLQMRPDQVAA